MLNYVSGNLFESPAQTLVNTVNTVGAMGKGIALQFKKFYPEMFREYQKLCEEGKLKIGVLHVFRTPHKTILNFPTKEDWRRPSKLEYIEKGLQTFVNGYQSLGIHSIAFPPLGCGNGELSWEDVRPLMAHYLRNLPIPVYLYPPQSKRELAEHRTPADVRAWLHASPLSMPFAEVWKDLRDLLALPLQLETFTKRTAFTAEFVSTEQEDFIRVRVVGVPKESIYGQSEAKLVWRDLRTHGVATSRTIDAKESAFLFPIFAQLPYVQAVRMAETFDKLTNAPTWALQIAPPPQEQMQGLLAV